MGKGEGGRGAAAPVSSNGRNLAAPLPPSFLRDKPSFRPHEVREKSVELQCNKFTYHTISAIYEL